MPVFQNDLFSSARMVERTLETGTVLRLKLEPLPGERVRVLEYHRKAPLVHLDYHLLNVMTDGSIVTGVIDWENVRLGDARYDVARTLSILCADPSIRALPKALRQVVRTFRRGYLEGYGHTAGPASLTALAPFLAWSGQFMLRDLGGRCNAQAEVNIERWSRWWQD